MRQKTCGIIVLLSAFISVGCGESAGNVKGKVTLNNKAVPVGVLGFSLEDGSKTYGTEVGADGTFEFSEPLVAGKYKVDYNVPELDTDKETPAMKVLEESVVPESFRAEVKTGDNDIHIKLEYRPIRQGDT